MWCSFSNNSCVLLTQLRTKVSHVKPVVLPDWKSSCSKLCVGKLPRCFSIGIDAFCILQRADWRLRPLSTEMEQYARTDAHYLLYIAHCLRAELLQPCKPSFVTQDLLLYHPREHIVYCVCMCFQFSISVSMENMGRFRRTTLCCCRWKTGEWRYLEAQGPHDRGCAPLQSIVPATLWERWNWGVINDFGYFFAGPISQLPKLCFACRGMQLGFCLFGSHGGFFCRAIF
jgi:hypothetical protein